MLLHLRYPVYIIAISLDIKILFTYKKSILEELKEFNLTVFLGVYDLICELVSNVNEFDCCIVFWFLFGEDVIVNSNSGIAF